MFGTRSLVTCLALASPVAADTDILSIYKQPGQPPQISAGQVDAFGAREIRQLLGEDFLVFEGTAPDPGRVPDPIDPEDDDPFPTQCYCPEDYRASLQNRIYRLGDSLRLTPGVRVPIDETMPDRARILQDPATVQRVQDLLASPNALTGN